MKKYLCILSLLPLSLYSQNFERTYSHDNARSLIQKADSSYVVGVSGLDHGFLSLNTSGDTISYKPAYSTTIRYMIKSRMGGTLMTGMILTPQPGDGCVIRLDDSLDSLKLMNLGGSYSTSGGEILELPDSSILVTRISPAGMSYFALDLFRLDMNGNTMWQATPWPPHDTKSTVYNIASDDSIVYTASNTSSLNIELYGLRLDSGTMVWRKEYYDTLGVNEYSTHSMIISGSSLYVAGAVNLTQMILKTDLNGDSIWMKEYDSGTFLKIISVSPNSFYAVGTYQNSVSLQHLDSNGTTIWTKYFQQFSTSYPFDLISTSDGGLAFCGAATDLVTHTNYTYVVKTDSAGNILSTNISEPAPSTMHFIFDRNNKKIYLSSERNMSGCSARIYSLNGQLILEEKLSAGENTIDVQRFARGEYIISVTGWSGKFIVE